MSETKTCENGRFARIENHWTKPRRIECSRAATHHAEGFAGSAVDVCPLHAAALAKYHWTIERLP